MEVAASQRTRGELAGGFIPRGGRSVPAVLWLWSGVRAAVAEAEAVVTAAVQSPASVEEEAVAAVS